MPREVITIGVGQCGCQISYAFWEKALRDHKLDEMGSFTGDKKNKMDQNRLDKIDVFFSEVGGKRYVPRALFVDLEPGVHNKLQAREIGKVFAPDRWIHGTSGAGNCWASGFFSEGNEIIPEVIDEVRRLVERSDCPQAIQVVHSIGGGTGSGTGSLVLEKLAANFLNILRCDYTVYPSKSVSDTVVEPYNAMCSMPHLIENCDSNFVLDNEAIYHISNNVVRAGRNTSELNHIITSAMIGTTASLRFPGWLNCDLRKLATNLVPFPRLHFYLLTHAPLTSLKASKYRNETNIRDLLTQMVSKTHFFAQINPDKGKYLTVAALFRGDIATEELEHHTNQLHSEMSGSFVNWIPDHFKTSHVFVPSETHKLSATFLANTTSMRGLFVRLNKQFGKLFKRKAFLAPYKAHGMDEMMFQEAQSNVKDLIQEYQDRNDVVVDPDTIYEDWIHEGGGDDGDDGAEEEHDSEAMRNIDNIDLNNIDIGSGSGGGGGDDTGGTQSRHTYNRSDSEI